MTHHRTPASRMADILCVIAIVTIVANVAAIVSVLENPGQNATCEGGEAEHDRNGLVATSQRVDRNDEPENEAPQHDPIMKLYAPVHAGLDSAS